MRFHVLERPLDRHGADRLSGLVDRHLAREAVVDIELLVANLDLALEALASVRLLLVIICPGLAYQRQEFLV